MRKKLCIRAEGGASIGMGHVMRMTELAQVLAKDMDVFFVSKSVSEKPEMYGAGIDFIMKRGFRVELLPATNFFPNLEAINADCFLTDSYDVTNEYFDFLKSHFPLSIYMDDENDICSFLNVDLIINQNPYADDLVYRTNSHTKKLLGFEYLILRDEFIGKSRKKITPIVQNVMVTVGGSDHDNITEKILKQLITFNYQLKIIIGGAFTHEEKLLSYASETVELCKNVRMSDVMDWCDVAVAACGSTAYELAAMGVPALGFSVAPNQELCLMTMDKIGTLKASKISSIARDMVYLTMAVRDKMSKQGQTLVDGRGKYRIAAAIKEIIYGA